MYNNCITPPYLLVFANGADNRQEGMLRIFPFFLFVFEKSQKDQSWLFCTSWPGWPRRSNYEIAAPAASCALCFLSVLRFFLKSLIFQALPFPRLVSFLFSSARSSYGHPNVLLTHPGNPHFQITPVVNDNIVYTGILATTVRSKALTQHIWWPHCDHTWYQSLPPLPAVVYFLGPRGPLIEPWIPVPSTRPPLPRQFFLSS